MCISANIGGQFFEVKQRWVPFVPGFSRICPDFQQIQIFGGAFAPASCTTAKHIVQYSSKKGSRCWPMQVVTRLQICIMQINFLPLYITSNMSNPITTGHFGALLDLHSLCCYNIAFCHIQYLVLLRTFPALSCSLHGFLPSRIALLHIFCICSMQLTLSLG